MTEATNQEGWNILLVDDEQDVHDATRLAIKRKLWRKRAFNVRSVFSGREARDVLRDPAYHNIVHVAVIDVVMESKMAGLDLCRYIRTELPRSVRIILRTGQPGVAPEERIINDYDIDYYMAKIEATPERLYTALRACLRSSQDIETLLAFGNQLRGFTSALQQMTSREDLSRFMRVGLDFLELKHGARIVFVSDVNSSDEVLGATAADVRAVARAHELQLELGKMHQAAPLGLEEDSFVMHFAVTVEGSIGAPVLGGFVVRTRSTLHGLHGDLGLFMQNWKIAVNNCMLYLELVEERRMLEQKVEQRTSELSEANKNLEKTLRALEERDDIITQDMMQARDFQQSILTKPAPVGDADVEVIYRPLELVGGDLYDLMVDTPNRLRIFLADATGHGVRASLTTMFIKSEYEGVKRTTEGPAAVLSALNDRIAGNYGLLGMRFTAVCADVDLERGVVCWASAGHPGPLHLHEGKVRELDGGGPFMGVLAGMTFTERETPFVRGDGLFLYTDGITETRDAAGEAFGEERLNAVIEEAAASRVAVGAAVCARLETFVPPGAPPEDDITFLGVHRTLEGSS